MSPEAKLLVIGLDGATFDILLPHVERGHMPHVASLLANGAWGRLESTIPPFTAAAWSTFATGQNPGRHGILSFRRRDRFNYDLKGSGFVDASRLGKTLWELIGDSGKKVGVVNVPMTYPPRPVNGFMVTGMMTPPTAATFTYPPALAEELGSDYIIDVNFIRERGQFRTEGFPPKQEMLDEIERMTAVQGRKSRELITQKAPDFFMIVFTGTDRVSHFFWEEMAHIVFGDGTATNSMVDAVIGYYARLDGIIGGLVEAAGGTANVMLMSDHGFGPAPAKRVYLNIWLEQAGLLARRGSAGLLDLEYWRVQIGRNRRLKALLRKVVPEKTQSAAKKTAESVSGSIIDWSKSRAYWVPVYFQVCGIEVNLRGANREGIVEQGAEYEAVREQIVKQVVQIRDPETGDTIVELAAKREELFSGPYLETIPDVIVVLKAQYVGAGSLAGTSLVENFTPARSGEHRQDGIFAISGPCAAKLDDVQNLRLVDVPPTILYCLGIAIPDNFDGRVMRDVLDANYLDVHPIEFAEAEVAGGPTSEDREVFSQREEAQLEERLRGLGYIE